MRLLDALPNAETIVAFVAVVLLLAAIVAIMVLFLRPRGAA